MPRGYSASTHSDSDRLALMRALQLTLIFALALGLYEARTHAHAGEPTRCGFWGSMDAGMSCR